MQYDEEFPKLIAVTNNRTLGFSKDDIIVYEQKRKELMDAVMAWNYLKKIANAASSTAYRIKSGLLRNYLIQEFKSSAVRFA